MGRFRDLAKKIVLGRRSPEAPARAPSPEPAPAPIQQEAAAEPAPTASSETVSATEATEGLPWYLEGDRDDGWDATNPGTEPERRNLTDD